MDRSLERYRFRFVFSIIVNNSEWVLETTKTYNTVFVCWKSQIRKFYIEMVPLEASIGTGFRE